MMAIDGPDKGGFSLRFNQRYAFRKGPAATKLLMTLS